MGDTYVLRMERPEAAAELLASLRCNGRLLDRAVQDQLYLDMPLPIGFTGHVRAWCWSDTGTSVDAHILPVRHDDVQVYKIGWVRVRLEESPGWLWRYLVLTDFLLCISPTAPVRTGRPSLLPAQAPLTKPCAGLD
jgi:hypothetical protein